jgi:hypothetical protein
MTLGGSKMHIRSLSFVLLIGLPAAVVSAQTIIPVTGWYDGSPTGDGVAHGNWAGGGSLWSTWGTVQQHLRWDTDIVNTPSAGVTCTSVPTFCANGTGGVQGVLPFGDDLYFFTGYLAGPAGGGGSGVIVDPIDVIARYGDGSWDLQQNVLYFPNTGLAGSSPYLWGTGTFAAPTNGPILPNHDQLYLFFGGTRTDIDAGRGAHMIGIATSPVQYVSGNPNQELSLAFHRFLDASSPNYSAFLPNPPSNTSDPFGLRVFNQSTGSFTTGYFTPLLARFAYRSPGGAPVPSRFGYMTGLYVAAGSDHYFYLFIGLSADTGGTLSFRIPYDASQPFGLAHNTDGTVHVEMWYKNTQGVAAYRQIQSNAGIQFSDDNIAGTNPAVPLANALVKDGVGANIHFPSGMFQYPLTGTPTSVWFSGVNSPVAPTFIEIYRAGYTIGSSNPWSVTKPYRVDVTNQTHCAVVGSCNLPSKYTAQTNITVFYPLDSQGNAGAITTGKLQACVGCNAGKGSGDIPFTVSGFVPY